MLFTLVSAAVRDVCTLSHFCFIRHLHTDIYKSQFYHLLSEACSKVLGADTV